ncbi:MAG: hypothetical protein UV78_C0013G0015 [Parcubacteria group bacterium GW2011_GWA2_43_17]|nr:MAG: hypothetical protein UV78_C0013G0015 [Parcubacteria group bacterium GW2011_GWA2_43_17]KKT93686.1 MAG: hypothetical protein UW91_C0008G0005 [Parcubacteria group bacterium GW2011_GWF2_45_11]KKT98264.1 MAG: hypothetical protein UW98_C0009G0005 [Parcubacteria group bacterium GW2011_GWC2_45_15]
MSGITLRFSLHFTPFNFAQGRQILEKFKLVGVVGLEPTTSRTPCVRASQLRYTPFKNN